MARELVTWEATLGGDGFPSPPRDEQAHSPSVAGAGSGLALPERKLQLDLLRDAAASCSACDLHQGRARSVFGRGGAGADVLFVGEGPGHHEEEQGEPFVGPAGQLLDKMVKAMGYERDAVYICDIVKCRPPEGRVPHADEARACSRFLDSQIELVSPRVIVALGRCAAENLGVLEPGGREWRGEWSDRRGVPVMATYHPAFLLRSPQFKRPAWEDLKKVIALLGRQGG